MLASYNNMLTRNCCSVFISPRVEGGVQHLHFEFFIDVLNLFFQHNCAKSYCLFLSSIDGCICVSHNRNPSGKKSKTSA